MVDNASWKPVYTIAGVVKNRQPRCVFADLDFNIIGMSGCAPAMQSREIAPYRPNRRGIPDNA